MINIEQLELEKLIFEVRYNKGLIYLDRSGIVMNIIMDNYPEFTNFSVGNINEGVSLISYNPYIAVNIRFDRIIVDIQFPSTSELKNYYEICDYAINMISEEFEVSTFTRVGNRFIYIYPLEDNKEVDNIIIENGPFSIDKGKLAYLGDEFTQPEFKVVMSDEEIGHTLRINSIFDREKEIEKRPFKIDTPEFAQKNGIQIDIDFFTKKEIDLSGLVCSELIHKNRRYNQKLVQTIFK